MAGLIYCGDNLDILNEYIPRESVDLIYLDPPFNSQRAYNLIYKDQRAQEVAFKDFWSWEEAAPTFHRIVESGTLSKPLRTLLRALHDVLIDGDSDQLAYLTMMTPRLVALHRALKPTGSLYLHCDPTASHYLKTIVDVIFGATGFLNEIIWKRTGAHSSAKRYGPIHDVILFYGKSESHTWTDPRLDYDDDYLDKYYKYDDGDGRLYWRNSLTAPGIRNGSSGNDWHGFSPTKKGSHWKFTTENLDALDTEGRIYWPPGGGWPQIKRFRDDLKGKAIADIWDDIDKINPAGNERLGYPTQKPLELMKRIILASSRPGELVLDPFCGCGTTVEAAERLGRRWIGIDVARKAIEVIEGRFEKVKLPAPEIVWHPADKASADALATRDKLGFEKWVLRKIRAARLRKKDRGIDGEARFKETDGKVWSVVVSVKGGRSLPPTFMRDLRGVIEREKAIGVFVSLVEPGKEMKLEAVNAGYLNVSDAEGPIPRLQIVTVDRLFKELPPIRCPGENVTEMPKASVPPPPVVGDQLALELVPKARASKPRVASTKPRKQPAKTYPNASDQKPLMVADSVRPRKK